MNTPPSPPGADRTDESAVRIGTLVPLTRLAGSRQADTFIGHFAVGFATKRFATRVPLTLLLVAAGFSIGGYTVMELAGGRGEMGNLAHYTFWDTCTELGKKESPELCIDGPGIQRDMIHTETSRRPSSSLTTS